MRISNLLMLFYALISQSCVIRDSLTTKEVSSPIGVGFASTTLADIDEAPENENTESAQGLIVQRSSRKQINHLLASRSQLRLMLSEYGHGDKSHEPQDQTSLQKSGRLAHLSYQPFGLMYGHPGNT